MGPSPDNQSRRVEHYLSENDARCPSCGYQLRGSKGVKCPECAISLDFEIVTKGPASVQDVHKYPHDAHPDPQIRRFQFLWFIAFGVLGLGAMTLSMVLTQCAP